jgi:LCP family protein required for cell wall assembly
MVRLAVVVALVAVMVLAAGGYGYARWRFGQIASVEVPGLHRQPPPGKPFVLLVVGSDARADLQRPGDTARFGTTQDADGKRSDVIMLVRADPKHKTVKVLSVPRDLLVPIAGTGGRNKINAEFADGPEQLIQTISQNLGVPINHYLLIDFDGFRGIVDALGGVRLDFPYPAADRYAGLAISRPGCQLLRGDQALAVARARHYRYYKDGRWQSDPLSDLGRIQRQQAFLLALLETGLAKGLTNPLQANRFIGAVVSDLTKDSALSVSDAVQLARGFRGFDPDQLATMALPTVAVNNYQGFGDVLLAKQPDADRAVASFLGRPTRRPTAAEQPPTLGRGVVVQVQNGTSTPSLAAQATSRLRGRGVAATTAGNADPTSRSVIRYSPDQQATARPLARTIMGAVRLQPDPGLPANQVIVVLGATYRGIRSTPASTAATPRSPPAGSSRATARDFDPRPC